MSTNNSEEFRTGFATTIKIEKVIDIRTDYSVNMSKDQGSIKVIS